MGGEREGVGRRGKNTVYPAFTASTLQSTVKDTRNNLREIVLTVYIFSKSTSP